MEKPEDLKKSVSVKYEELKTECAGNLEMAYQMLGDWCYDRASWYHEHPYTIKQFRWEEQ